MIWSLAAVAAFCIGVSKAGFSGISLISVFILADIFGAKESLGFALPMLIIADLLVYPAFRKYACWKSVWLLTWPALIGMAAGVVVLDHVDNPTMARIIGAIILLMASLQLIGKYYPDGFYKLANTKKFGFFLWLDRWCGDRTSKCCWPNHADLHAIETHGQDGAHWRGCTVFSGH